MAVFAIAPEMPPAMKSTRKEPFWVFFVEVAAEAAVDLSAPCGGKVKGWVTEAMGLEAIEEIDRAGGRAVPFPEIISGCCCFDALPLLLIEGEQ